MYQRAKYFSEKFIANGIGCILLSVYLIYAAVIVHQTIKPLLYITLIAGLGWLLIGWRLRKKIRQKIQFDMPNNSEVNTERMGYQNVDLIFSILIVLLISFGEQLIYQDFIAIGFIIAYSVWVFFQIKLMNNFFQIKQQS